MPNLNDVAKGCGIKVSIKDTTMQILKKAKNDMNIVFNQVLEQVDNWQAR